MTLYAFRITTIMRFLFSKVKDFFVKTEYLICQKKIHGVNRGFLYTLTKLTALQKIVSILFHRLGRLHRLV